ncbi:MAG: hypothetical protein KAV00_11975 [Phycisphaerae bacterium]|nr:hypothetical protein [Phycisphaerae bacterium]
MSWLKRPFKALQSRKVRVALVTVLVAVAAEYGLELSDTMLLGIIGVGTAIILGIAHEDNGTKQAQWQVKTHLLKPGTSDNGG